MAAQEGVDDSVPTDGGPKRRRLEDAERGAPTAGPGDAHPAAADDRTDGGAAAAGDPYI